MVDSVAAVELMTAAPVEELGIESPSLLLAFGGQLIKVCAGNPPWQNYGQVSLDVYMISLMPLIFHQAALHSEDFVLLSGWVIPVTTRDCLGRY